MASSLPKPAPVKRLGELLQEQQEPFLLDVYLLERGYSKKSPNSKGKSGYGGLKSRKGISHCPKILRSVLNKIVSANDNKKMSNFDTRAYEDGRFSVCEISGKTHQIAELDQFSSISSSSSSMTVFDSCSESDTEQESPSSHSKQNPISSTSTSTDTFQAFKICNLADQKADTDRTHRRGCMEGSKQQHSPVSVLVELPSDEVRFCSRTNKKEIPSTSSLNRPKKVTDDSIFSASLWELVENSLIEKQGYVGAVELQGVLGIASASQYLKNKRVLEQTKQLLFDCEREAVETHGRKGRKSCVHEFLGAEELGNTICGNICLWGKKSGNVTNITQLINSDFWDSIEEWSDFQPQIREVEMEIVDAILEEIRNEIVIDMTEY